MRTDDLAAMTIAKLMEKNPDVDPSAIDDVILGCANQAGEDNRNVARWQPFWRDFLGAFRAKP